MTFTPWKVLAGAVAAMLLAYGAFTAFQHYHQAQGTKDEQQAQVFKGEANAHQTQAQASDAKVADLQAKVDAQVQDLGKLQKERDGLLRKLAAKVPAVPGSPDLEPAGGTGPAPVDDPNDQVIAKDAEVIAQQGFVIQSQKIEILQLTESRDQWKATADLREKQAMAQEAATAAWKKAVTESRWRGRVEGFVAGVASGYVAGRLH